VVRRKKDRNARGSVILVVCLNLAGNPDQSQIP
jgi:hypothetical protein